MPLVSDLEKLGVALQTFAEVCPLLNDENSQASNLCLWSCARLQCRVLNSILLTVGDPPRARIFFYKKTNITMVPNIRASP